MTPPLAAVLCGLTIVALFYLDRDREPRTSPALWLPIAWTCLGASRMVSQWLGTEIHVESPDQYLAGSPLDRAILSGLILAGMLVLIARGRRSADFLTVNGPLLLFLAYCAASTMWSDYPFVAFKRWIKALGNVVMVLVVLTDPYPAAAINRFFARAAFLMLPASVLLVTYYPDWGRRFYRYTGLPYYTGVATDKNSLGALCVVFGLAALWRLIEVVRDAGGADRLRPLAAYATVVGLAVWLIQKANSFTALICFVLGGLVMLVTVAGRRWRSATSYAAVGALAGAGLVLYLFADPQASLVGALGRDTSLTGRTTMWRELFGVTVNPWLGTGFETFWLGDRARVFWEKYYYRPNQAHNGYIETYLNLGWLGVGLLVLLIASGFRNVIAGFRRNVPASTLKLAVLIVALIYNVTEAAFKVMHPVWIAFLFAVIAVPDRAASRADLTSPSEGPGGRPRRG